MGIRLSWRGGTLIWSRRRHCLYVRTWMWGGQLATAFFEWWQGVQEMKVYRAAMELEMGTFLLCIETEARQLRRNSLADVGYNGFIVFMIWANRDEMAAAVIHPYPI